MAKIVTYDKQIDALNEVTDALKQLEKLQPLIMVQTETGNLIYKINISVLDESKEVKKTRYNLNEQEGRELVLARFRHLATTVVRLSEEFHIGLNEEEQRLIEINT